MEGLKNSPKILIVEDEFLIAMDMMTTLQSMGYSIQGTVESGERALEAVAGERPDLVLMDIQLPGDLDGIETATLIHDRYRIPVIYVSAFSDQMTVDRAKIAQPFGYITKPFNNRELHTAIEVALYKHRMEQLLEDSRELLSTTLKSIGDAVITTNAEGTILFLNDSAAALLGGKLEEITGKLLNEVIELEITPDRPLPDAGRAPGPEKETIRSVLSRLSGEVRSTRTRKVCGNVLRSRDGAVFVECSASPLIDQASLAVTGLVYVFRNISGQVKVREIQQRLASIVQYSEDAIIGLSLDGRIESWNRGAEKLFGYGFAEVAGKNISLLSPAQQPDELPEFLSRIARGESIEHFETFRVDKSGRVINLVLTLSPMVGVHGSISGISLIGKNISEMKMLERRIMEISSHERQLIGQELHDNLGQQLTGIFFRAEALKNMLTRKNAGEESRLAEDIARLLRDALGETRKLARGLMPVSMQPEGLPGALREIAEQAESLFSVPITLDLDEGLLVNDSVTANQIYGIAREAVYNALKHGHPKCVSVRLERDYAELVLTVQDDGRGFVSVNSEGLGLRIMKYRAKMIGAHLEIFSPREGGTIVVCRVSLPEPSDCLNTDERGI